MQVRRRDKICAARWHKKTCGTLEFGGGQHGRTDVDLVSGKLLALHTPSACIEEPLETLQSLQSVLTECQLIPW
jgi:hypothetical protein